MIGFFSLLALSEQKMREIEASIEADKKKLAQQTNMAEEEKQKLLNELTTRENELQSAK